METARTTTVLHLANHGSRNIGNAALIHGLERVLREDLGQQIDFVPEHWDAYSRGVREFDESFVEHVNRDCDMLLVGAAVAFDGAGKYANTGFRFDLPLELWQQIEPPIVLYGLSHRAWARRPYHHRDRLARTLDAALSNERVLFSVRNDGTKEWLERIAGTALPGLHVVPDPAVYVPVEDTQHPELDPERPTVLVAPNAEDEIERFGTAARKRGLRVPDPRRPLPFSSSWGWREERERVLRQIAAALSRLVLEHEANLLFCSNDPFDVEMAFELFGLLEPEARYSAGFAGAALPVKAGPSYYDLYAKVDVVIGMRIHAMTPAVGLGTPVVPVVSQERMRVFMSEVGLADIWVEMLDDHVGERIHDAAAAALEDGAPLRARLAEVRDRLRRRTAEFDAKVAAVLGR